MAFEAESAQMIKTAAGYGWHFVGQCIQLKFLQQVIQ
jgi:hypothetical protein